MGLSKWMKEDVVRSQNGNTGPNKKVLRRVIRLLQPQHRTSIPEEALVP